MPLKICESSIFTTYHKEFWFSANFIFTLFSIFLFLIKLDKLPVPLKKANTKLLLANIMHRIKKIIIKTCREKSFILHQIQAYLMLVSSIQLYGPFFQKIPKIFQKSWVLSCIYLLKKLWKALKVCLHFSPSYPLAVDKPREKCICVQCLIRDFWPLSSTIYILLPLPFYGLLKRKS